MTCVAGDGLAYSIEALICREFRVYQANPQAILSPFVVCAIITTDEIRGPFNFYGLRNGWDPIPSFVVMLTLVFQR